MAIDFILNRLRGLATPTPGPGEFINSGATVNLKFPEDLFAVEKCKNVPHVLIDLKDSTTDNRILYSIALYMPSGVSVGYQGNWQAADLETPQKMAQLATLGSEALKTVDQTIGAYNQGGLAGAAKKVWDESSNGSTVQEQLLNRRVLSNPHQAQSYSGPSFREFQFEFNMMARSSKESNSIANIIRVLKWGMHPSAETRFTIEKSTWQYPNEFDIRFYTAYGKSDYMFELRSCILQGIQVTYGPESANFFTSTSAPVDVTMTLNFKETVLLTKEDFGGTKPILLGADVSGNGSSRGGTA